MHTHLHTDRTRAPHTLRKGQVWYYNRRVPKHLQSQYGPLLRISLSSNQSDAFELAARITAQIDKAWANGRRIDLRALVEECSEPQDTLTRWTEEYLEIRSIQERPVHIAVDALVRLVGDKDVREFRRADAREFLRHLKQKGNATRTIRRRIDAVGAILNYAFAELEVDRRNPFSRVLIPREGEDAFKRATFTDEELVIAYSQALSTGRSLHLLVPLLGETGCRLGEIVGLRRDDVDLENGNLQIVGHVSRRLKTKHSERIVPLVGCAFEAVKRLLERNEETYLFPRYVDAVRSRSTYASNALNKWLKPRFEGKTAHCFRHTFRDRLRAVECPIDLIDELGGWKSINTVGVGYGRGYALEHKREWLNRVKIDR